MWKRTLKSHFIYTQPKDYFHWLPEHPWCLTLWEHELYKLPTLWEKVILFTLSMIRKYTGKLFRKRQLSQATWHFWHHGLGKVEHWSRVKRATPFGPLPLAASFQGRCPEQGRLMVTGVGQIGLLLCEGSRNRPRRAVLQLPKIWQLLLLPCCSRFVIRTWVQANQGAIFSHTFKEMGLTRRKMEVDLFYIL